MATLKDVAREAGVNISTVSRALTGSYGVRKSTREKVREVAARLNYRPNRLARGLVTGRSHAIGLLISDIRNPFFAEFARGAEDAAYEAGCELILCNSDLAPAKEMKYFHSLLEKRVDGIVINSVASLGREAREELAGCGVPIVLLNQPSDPLSFSTVLADNAQGGLLAGNYLTGMGHKVIAHLGGPAGHGNLAQRCEGFLEAVRSAGRTVVPIVMRGRHNELGGYELTKKLFASHPEVTAIFAANDAMAFGVIRAMAEIGRRIPEDVSLVGFDNVSLSGIVHPPLTTIHQPKYEMGSAAVEILLKVSRSSDPYTSENRTFGVTLIERDSCRALSSSNPQRRGGPGKPLPEPSAVSG